MSEANNATNGNMPDLSTLTKVWISETLYGEKTQISYTKEIPELEEAPEQVTERVLDLDYEIAREGIKSATTMELPMLFTHEQHKRLRAKRKQLLYFFFELPEDTAIEEGKPLVRYLQGTSYLSMDTISAGEFLNDKLTIYKTSDVLESDGFPTQNNTQNNG